MSWNELPVPARHRQPVAIRRQRKPRMKILMLFPYAPLPPPLDLAGTKRNLPFLLELARRHEVSVLSFGTPAEEAMFRQSYGHLCREVQVCGP